jgi:hypothetical protein
MDSIWLLEISAVVIFMFFLTLFLLKLPILPYTFFLRMMKIPHDQAQDWKISKINDWVKKRDKSEKALKAIYGEFKGFRTVQHALSQGLDAQVIFGDRIYDQQSKDRLIDLKTRFGDRLHVFKLNYRPLEHSTLINNNYFLESKHTIRDNYESALVYNNADNKIIESFNAEFERLKRNAVELDLGRIAELGLYFPETGDSGETDDISPEAGADDRLKPMKSFTDMMIAEEMSRRYEDPEYRHIPLNILWERRSGEHKKIIYDNKRLTGETDDTDEEERLLKILLRRHRARIMESRD